MPPPQSLQLNSESAGAARIFIYAFPLLLMDIIRRAHPVAPHQFQIVSESAALAPGLQDDDPRAIVTSAWVDVAHGPVAVRLPPTSSWKLSSSRSRICGMASTLTHAAASSSASGSPSRRAHTLTMEAALVG